MKRLLPVAVYILLLLSLLGALPVLGAPAAQPRPVDLLDDVPLIRLQKHSFDPLEHEPIQTPPLATAATPDQQRAPQIYLVQFQGPVHPEWKQTVTAAGAQLYGYIPDYAFLAWMDAPTAARVAQLEPVRWVGLYHPAYRLAPELAMPQLQATSRLTVTIETLPHIDLDRLRVQITEWGGTVQAQTSNQQAGYLQVRIAAPLLEDLATLPGVVWIQPTPTPTTRGDRAGNQVMRVAPVRSELQLFGAGQIVAVSDTGLDTGDLATLTPDLQNRVRQVYALGRPQNGDWSDIEIGEVAGHGTHVVGSILGSGLRSGSNPAQQNYTNSYAGLAPEAELIFQSIADETGRLSGIPLDYGDLMRRAHQDGARIHSNSWGGSYGSSDNPFGLYTSQSRQVDLAAWEHPDMLILFPAGNSGSDSDSNGVIDPDSIEQPGSAKNVLTVGGSENDRPELPRAYGRDGFGNVLKAPFYLESMTNNPNGMTIFSSRGPTDDQRIKPDLVAPATYIVSLRAGKFDGWDTLARVGLAAVDDEIDQSYVMLGGTSMATALTAGAATLVREWLMTKRALTNPSAALMKAVLINGAADMAPGQYGTEQYREIPAERPNSVNGWGRVDLTASLLPTAPREIWLRDEPVGLATSETLSYTVTVGDDRLPGARPLRATLIWTDYPGEAGSARQLVNDLDLEIIGPDGEQFVGNEGTYQNGPCLRAETWDSCNNVEGIVVENARPGDYTVVVHGHNVPQGPSQPYALVVSGDYIVSGRNITFVPQLQR